MKHDAGAGRAAGNGRVPSVRMSWVDLLFLHWRVEPEAMRPLVPAELELDLFDGSAWVALVPFRMDNTRFRGLPVLPGVGRFHECNVRTYVRSGELAGVWFFSLDAARLLPVLGGRWGWGLDYVYGRFEVSRLGDDGFDYRLRRLAGPWPPGRTHVKWRAGASIPTAAPGSLEHFLTERYWLFTRRRGRVLAGEVAHEPWPLREASVEHLDDTLIRAGGVEVSGEPLAWACDGIDVLGWGLIDPLASSGGARDG